MNIVGVNRGDHDASACLVRDGRLVSFISAERLTREKHDRKQVWAAVRYCLEAAGLDNGDVDLVVQNAYEGDIAAYDEVVRSSGRIDDASEFFSQFEAVITVSHHLAHAYCGLALSPFAECAVMVVDGFGQQMEEGRYEAESYFNYRGGVLERVGGRLGRLEPDGLGFHGMDSIGGVYSAVSSYLFGDWNACGKVMGLAAFGGKRPVAWEALRARGGTLEVDLEFRKRLVRPHLSPEDWAAHEAEYAEIAHAVQRQTEEALLELSRDLHRVTGASHLVISGGVGLNCLASGKILAHSPFERVFVPPACADDGIAVGGAYYGWLEHAGRPKVFSLASPHLGRTYGPEAVARALAEEPAVRSRPARNPEREAARRLAGGEIVGWFQGASALGPRALGERSLLADPRDPAMPERVNARVKHREPFRPYGASVLAEAAAEYFECREPMPYMTFAVPVRAEAGERIPAVVHADRTCRIQTVAADDNPSFRRLLEEFHGLTGVPVLLNTSFNVEGEPIVETPEDALGCFLATDLDLLFLGENRVERQPLWEEGRLAPVFSRHRLSARRQFDVTRHLFPGGRTEHSLLARFPRRFELHGVSEDLLEVLALLPREPALAEVLNALAIAPDTARGRALASDLLLLIRNRVLGLVAPGPDTRDGRPE